MGDFAADLFRQNEWANLVLIEACRGLTPAQLDSSAVGTYGPIRETLIHLVAAETRYVRRLGGIPARTLHSEDQWEGFDVIEDVVRSSAVALLKAAQTTAGSTLELIDIDEDDPERRFHVDATVVLVQAVNHSTEHRGQICTVMTSLGISPPTLDGWAWGWRNGRTLPIAW